MDRFSKEELQAEYPQLASSAAVRPDIVADAETLEGIPSASADFVIAAHLLEHMRNPLLALSNWARVVRAGGLIYLVVPDKRATFDAHRVRTTLEHLLLDYTSPSEERDREHYLDYARFVHGRTGLAALAEADRLLAIGFSIHYHVFLPEDVVSLVTWFSQNVERISIVDGPVSARGTGEFHLLLARAS